jgi:hypothetical protein
LIFIVAGSEGGTALLDQYLNRTEQGQRVRDQIGDGMQAVYDAISHGLKTIFNSEKADNAEGEKTSSNVTDDNKTLKDMRKLSPGQIKKLKQAGVDIHDLKGDLNAGSEQDLYIDKNTGDIYVGNKNGKGAAENTGLNVNNY